MTEKFSKRMKLLIKGMAYFAIPIFAFYLMEAYEHNPFKEVRQTPQLLNILLFELIAWFLFFVFKKARIALSINLVAAMVFGLTNHYVMAFRSTPFVPWDIFSIKTASSVASNYDFTPSTRIVVVTLAFVALIVLVQYLKFECRIKLYFRAIPAVIIMVCLSLFVGALQNEDFQNKNNLYPFLFTPAYMTKVNGMAVTFAMDLAYLKVDKPQGYSQKAAEELLAEYTPENNTTIQKEEYPNIIVIMDEAFSDVGVLGGLLTAEDYMPYTHSLLEGADNTISGYLNVSVCGGNTANTEYEFLTGNSMAFLPVGSIPYQQYIKGEKQSLASHLKSLGYATYAQHPYYASGWNRDTVYPNLGFDNLSFINDYVGAGKIRNYISDESDFNKVISTFANKPEGQPAFIFNVTMQNHGGYTDTYDGFRYSVQVQGIESQPLEQYLTLVQTTDQQLESLIQYFSQVDEKTIVVFFGDHQPNDTIAAPIIRAAGKDYKNLSEEDTALRYQVPYIIWANYDIKEATGQDTSANYLAAKVLETAQLPLTEYQNYLLDLSETLPIVSATRQVWAGQENQEKLLEYQRLAYYQLIDR